MTNKIRDSVRSSLFVYAELILTKIITFFIPVILVRNLSKAEYGSYVLIFSIALIVSYATSFGLEATLSRYIPEFLAKKQPRKINVLLKWSLALRASSLSIVLAILFIFKVEVSKLLNAPPVFTEAFLFILIFIGLVRMLSLFGESLLTSYHQRHYVSVMRVLGETLRLIAVVSVVYVFHGGLYELVLAMCVYESIVFTIYAVLALKKVCENHKAVHEQDSNAAEDRLNIRRIGRFSLFSTLTQSVYSFRDVATDSLVIAYYSTAELAANYGVASFFASFIRLFCPSRMLSGIFGPAIVRERAENNHADILNTSFKFLYKTNLFLLLPMTAGALLIGDRAIYFIFGPSYAEVTGTMYVLVSALFVANLGDIYDRFTSIIEKKEISFIAGTWAVYNLVLDIILIPKYGIMGAAIATGSAGILNHIYFWFMYRFKLKIKLDVPYRAGVKMLASTAIMAVPLLLLHRYINSLAFVVLSVVLGAATYLVASYFIKPFSAKDRAFINKKLNKPWFVF